MKIKFLMLIVFILVLSSFVSAQLIFKSGSFADLRVPCSISGDYCSSTTFCNATIRYPDGTYMYELKTMFYNHSTGDANLSLMVGNILGEYSYRVTCKDGQYNGTYTGNFQITPSGREKPSSGESMNLVITIITMLFFGILFFLISFAFKNNPPLRFFFIGLAVVVGLLTVLYSYVSLAETFGGFSKVIESYSAFLWLIGFLLVIFFLFILLSLTKSALEKVRARKGLTPSRQLYGEGYRRKRW